MHGASEGGEGVRVSSVRNGEARHSGKEGGSRHRSGGVSGESLGGQGRRNSTIHDGPNDVHGKKEGS
ncbi:hypothetical protein VNO77_22941 [Canavalia gladiata]|uniref:Uncharacterized protein n=1 Tax=Canavalia gladiata TaxID=3824 RepID=A0AAN9QB94_CANGL